MTEGKINIGENTVNIFRIIEKWVKELEKKLKNYH